MEERRGGREERGGEGRRGRGGEGGARYVGSGKVLFVSMATIMSSHHGQVPPLLLMKHQIRLL